MTRWVDSPDCVHEWDERGYPFWPRCVHCRAEPPMSDEPFVIPDLLADGWKANELQPGALLRHKNGETVTLDRRKTPDDGFPYFPGWWLSDHAGGLADAAIDDPDSPWTVLSVRDLDVAAVFGQQRRELPMSKGTEAIERLLQAAEEEAKVDHLEKADALVRIADRWLSVAINGIALA